MIETSRDSTRVIEAVRSNPFGYLQRERGQMIYWRMKHTLTAPERVLRRKNMGDNIWHGFYPALASSPNSSLLSKFGDVVSIGLCMHHAKAAKWIINLEAYTVYTACLYSYTAYLYSLLINIFQYERVLGESFKFSWRIFFWS